mgnify:CR=1 FL=1
MKIPADMIMIEGQDVTCNESELNGEPDFTEKTATTVENYKQGAICAMLAKSLVATGFGKAMVITVGPATNAGVITLETQKPTKPTLLQERLATIADKIGNVGIACAILTFFAMVFRIILEMSGVRPCGCANLFTCEE